MGRKLSRCDCGRVKALDCGTCIKCHNNRMAECKTKALSVVATGKCPDCGTGLVRNNALAGWWQCGCYGTDTFRELQYRGLSDCSFQCFTE